LPFKFNLQRYMSVKYGASLGLSGAKSVELSVRGLQVDDMNPRAAFPVLLWWGSAR
jgi:hypothetical protein